MSDSKTPNGKPAEAEEEDLTRYLPDATAALSEDANAGLSTPIMDLVAAAVVSAVAIWITVESLLLPIPGKLITAPGLLPFITAVMLLGMAGILALDAWNRSKAANSAGHLDLPADFRRSLVLAVLLTIYIAALHFIQVNYSTTIAGVRVTIGSFELVSVVALTAILKSYARMPLWLCLTVIFGWVAFLSIAFRIMFHIQLP